MRTSLWSEQITQAQTAAYRGLESKQWWQSGLTGPNSPSLLPYLSVMSTLLCQLHYSHTTTHPVVSTLQLHASKFEFAACDATASNYQLLLL